MYLSKVTGLKVNQIQNWFINARKRYLEPLIADEEKRKEASQLMLNENGRHAMGMEETFGGQQQPKPSIEAILSSNQAAFSRFGQIMQHIKPSYDSTDPSEAVILNEPLGLASESGSEQDLLIQQYYNFYLNNFLAFLNLQNRFIEQKKLEQKLPPGEKE